MKEHFPVQGATPVGGTPAEFAQLINNHRKRCAQIIRERAITVD